MSVIWWVRHGPTHARGMVGRTDLPADLSDAAALRRLEAALPAGAPLVSSDLLRARSTADALAGGRPRLPHDPDLRELDFGAWEMRGHDEIAAEEPELAFAFWDRPGDVRPPGGESWNDLRRRVDAAADRIAARGRDVVAVAHFGVILSQYQRAAGLTARAALAQRIEPLSLTRIRTGPGSGVEAVNERP